MASLALLAILLVSGLFNASFAFGESSAANTTSSNNPALRLSAANVMFTTVNPSLTSPTSASSMKAALNRASTSSSPVTTNCGVPYPNYWGPGTACGACPTPGMNGFPDQPVVACWSSNFRLPKSVDYYTTNSTPGEKCPCVVPYAMIGTNPASTKKTTTIGVDLVPINVNFGVKVGSTFDGSSVVASTLNSPLFKANSNYGMGGAPTQYENAMFRAEFIGDLGGPNGASFNVLLGNPSTQSTFHFKMPSNTATVCTSSIYVQFHDGCGAVYNFCSTTGSCQLMAVIDPNYFQYVILQEAVDSVNINPAHLSIFLTSNIVLGDPLNIANYCCIIGFHGWDQTGQLLNGNYFTFTWASYTAPGFATDIFGTPTNPVYITDINALSHEIGEWMNDPWTNNALPYEWSVNNQPQYGCSPILEVGDPLVGVVIPINGYHPQDLAYFSWFAQQIPSIGFGGATRYDYLGALGTSPPNPNICLTG